MSTNHSHASLYQLGLTAAATRGGARVGTTPGQAGLAAGIGVGLVGVVVLLLLGVKPGWRR